MKELRIPFSKARRESKYVGDNVSSERKEGRSFFSSPSSSSASFLFTIIIIITG